MALAMESNVPAAATDRQLVERYAGDFSVPREIAEIVAQRFPEYSAAKRHLFPRVDDLHDPSLMPDIDIAARLILDAIRRREGILIYTHDDVDGYTSAAVMYKTLVDIARQSDTIHVYPIVREQDGYVINPQVLRAYRRKGARLLLTVDFGISNEENFRIAEQEGLNAVICDHHETQLTVFPAPAVNPKRRDSGYPFRELAGVGVAYKLAQHLYQRSFGLTPDEFYRLKKSFFPLVGLGTLADRVALRDENRIFCVRGVELMTQADDPWLRCLRQEGEVDIPRLLKEVLPALGSAAYVDPRLGVDFFVERDVERVRACYSTLRATDQQRRQEIETLFGDIVSRASLSSRLAFSKIEITRQHHLGSLAARMRDHFRRNALIIGVRGERCVGELRSCDLDLYGLLCRMRGHFIDFGGHQKAAGFSMESGNIETFLGALEQELRRAPDFADQCGWRASEPEAQLERSQAGMLRRLMPFGEGSPAPLLTDGFGDYTVDNALNIIERTG